MTEVRFWTALSEVLPCTTQRLTDRLADAVPDLLWTWDGVTGLTELKVAELRRDRTSFRIAWRPGQAAWLWRWARAGACTNATICVADQWLVVLRPEPELAWVKRVQAPLRLFTEPTYPARPLRAAVPWLREQWTSATARGDIILAP